MAELVERDCSGRFVAGHNGMGGRPVGARTRIAELFLTALADDFELHGVGAIERVRESDPGLYLRIMGGALPRETKDAVDRLPVVHVDLTGFKEIDAPAKKLGYEGDWHEP